MTTRLFRYCHWSRLADALALGWLPAGDLSDTHHGAYSACLVEWICDCKARWPV